MQLRAGGPQCVDSSSLQLQLMHVSLGSFKLCVKKRTVGISENMTAETQRQQQILPDNAIMDGIAQFAFT